MYRVYDDQASMLNMVLQLLVASLWPMELLHLAKAMALCVLTSISFLGYGYPMGILPLLVKADSSLYSYLLWSYPSRAQ